MDLKIVKHYERARWILSYHLIQYPHLTEKKPGYVTDQRLRRKLETELGLQLWSLNPDVIALPISNKPSARYRMKEC